MPRFSEFQKTRVRQGLLSLGEELFAAQGVKAVTVESLALAVGISKGAFYHFFASKEDLFIEVQLNAEKEVRSRMEETNVYSSLRTFLEAQFRALEARPFFLKMMDPLEMRNVLLKASPEGIKRLQTADSDYLLSSLRRVPGGAARSDQELETWSQWIKTYFWSWLQRSTIGIQWEPLSQLWLSAMEEKWNR